jgi:hypothetical protein
MPPSVVLKMYPLFPISPPQKTPSFLLNQKLLNIFEFTGVFITNVLGVNPFFLQAVTNKRTLNKAKIGFKYVYFALIFA